MSPDSDLFVDFLERTVVAATPHFLGEARARSTSDIQILGTDLQRGGSFPDRSPHSLSRAPRPLRWARLVGRRTGTALCLMFQPVAKPLFALRTHHI